MIGFGLNLTFCSSEKWYTSLRRRLNRLLSGLQGLLEVCVVGRVLNSGGEVLHGLLELTQAVEDQAPVVVGSC